MQKIYSTTRFFILSLAFVSAVWAVQLNEAKQITVLDAAEPYYGQVFHAGLLWVGKSRQNLSSQYLMEVYDASGKLLAATPLSHALNSVAPYGANSVLVVGRQPGSRSSHSIVTWSGGKLSVRTTAHPVEAFVEDATGVPGGPIYLVMIGGETLPPTANPSIDPEGYRTLFTLTGFNGISYLAPKLSNVGLVRQIGKFVYAIERHIIGSGDENLTRIDVRTQTASRVFPKADRRGLYNFIVSGDGKHLVAAEREANQVHLIDIEKNAVLKTVAIPGNAPHALAEWGKCVVVGSVESRKVSFVDFASKGRAIVAEWDFSGIDPSLNNLVNVSVEPKSSSLFLRSTLACNPFVENCSVSKNSVWQVRREAPVGCISERGN